MTEAEWFASTDPVAMAEVVMNRKRASPRVLRLYLVAFWVWQSHRIHAPNGEWLRKLAAFAEEWADSGVMPDDVRRVTARYDLIDQNPKRGFRGTVAAPRYWGAGAPAAARAVWALRELFGNPFATRKRKADPHRGWTFDPAWRTATVLALANRIYDARDFRATPILADALQDAGCTNEDLLSHCREPGEHVRGCWALDLVLEKS